MRTSCVCTLAAFVLYPASNCRIYFHRVRQMFWHHGHPIYGRRILSSRSTRQFWLCLYSPRGRVSHLCSDDWPMTWAFRLSSPLIYMLLHIKSIVISPVLHNVFPMFSTPHCQRGIFLPWLVHPAGVRSEDRSSGGLKAAWFKVGRGCGVRVVAHEGKVDVID